MYLRTEARQLSSKRPRLNEKITTSSAFIDTAARPACRWTSVRRDIFEFIVD
jgi:hypothetical protein